MSESNQNHALVFFLYLTRMVGRQQLKVDVNNPKAILLNTYASSIFTCGRDMENMPFIGVPSKLVPFFTQIDWVEASICRSLGYIFLEARDPATQSLNMAFGIKTRRSRLDVFCIEGHENVKDLCLNIKIFEQDPENPKEVVFSEQHELVNITLKEIDGTVDLGTEFDNDEAISILKQSGVDQSFAPVTLKM